MDAPAKPQTIALYVDLFRDHARAAAKAIAAALGDAGFAIAFDEEQARELAIDHGVARLADAELLVTIGGDGTLLRAAQLAAPLGIPLFGINTGRLGFLTEIDGADLDVAALPALLAGGFAIDERFAIVARAHDRSHFALNDIVVTRTKPHMTPFSLYIDGREAARVPADGIVVATPTGSTAYSLSAGGPIVAPNTDAVIVSALLPHTLFSRPLVVPSSSEIRIVCDRETSGVALEADGIVVDELHPGDEVTIDRYAIPIRFARREPLDFFGLLEGKLRWNAPVKDR
jgi:NAD+ kinase